MEASYVDKKAEKEEEEGEAIEERRDGTFDLSKFKDVFQEKKGVSKLREEKEREMRR